MNSGLLPIRNYIRQNKDRNRPRYVGPLVFNPIIPNLVDAVAAGTATADKNTSLTPDMSGTSNIPVDGSVIGFMVQVLVRNSVVNAGTYVEVGDYDHPLRPVGAIPGSAGHFWQTYGGKVANHYDAHNIDIVYTGGLNNTQFKYAVQWGAGTTTYYIRILGFWTAAEGY